MVGESVDIPLQLQIGSCAQGEATNYTNIAEIDSHDILGDGPTNFDYDSTPGNGVPGEDDIDSQPLDIFDLSLSKTLIDNVGPNEYGQILEYEITVTNERNSSGRNIRSRRGP